MNLIEKAAERLKLAKRDEAAAAGAAKGATQDAAQGVAKGAAQGTTPDAAWVAIPRPMPAPRPGRQERPQGHRPGPNGADRAAVAPGPEASAPPPTGMAAAEAVEAVEAADVAEAAAPQARRSRIATINEATLKANGIAVGPDDRNALAEEFRLIKRPMLLKAFAKGPNKIRNGHLIMVSSARPGEGKTFCALSLALSIATERDLTVLLIDADIAKPEVCRRLGIEADRGLTDLLDDDKLDLADVLIRTNLNKLSILPPGQPKALATELLASERMERLVEDIATRYPDRVIIFDSPPVLASSAPGVLALHVGQVLFVVEAERTPQAAVESALSHLGGCEHIGVILNKTRDHGKVEQMGHYYPYYGSN